MPEPGQRDRLRDQGRELRVGDHRVELAAGQRHRHGGGGEQRGHAGLADAEGGRVERGAPAVARRGDGRVQRRVVGVDETVEAGHPEVASDRLGAGGERLRRAPGQRRRSGQLLTGPLDLDADTDDGPHTRAGGEVERDDATERVTDDHGAARVDQARDGLGDGGDRVGRQGWGAAVAGEVRCDPRGAVEVSGEAGPHVGGGAEAVQQQQRRRPTAAGADAQIVHRTSIAHRRR
ncbi:hypothetical protein GCM10009557_70170 [Virgisporangium ochraceum]